MGSTSSKLDEDNSKEKEIIKNGDDGDLVFTANGSKRVSDNNHFQKNESENTTSIIRVPKAMEGEQIAAGWPSWLTSVAGEAINGWVPRRADSFEKLDKIGQGTYSNVYKARDTINGNIVALKKVRFDIEPESVKFMAREILILRRLDHPNVMKLEGLVTSNLSASLYLVFEYMEHDLTGLASLPGVKFTESQVKCYMHQLLTGLDYCHSRGVLHRDIKCSNLLLDNNGKLKIADFGLSSFFDNHKNIPLTSRVVTLWYRPPELLLGATSYGVGVDLWSTGCVLGEIYAGKPIMPGRTEVEQLHKIFKLCGSPSDDYWRKSKLPHTTIFKPREPYKSCLREAFKDIAPTVLSLLLTLLSHDPEHRGTAASALQSEFFKTEPLACDPSSLPEYPPSKEADVRRFTKGKANSRIFMGAPGPYGRPNNTWKNARADANTGFADSTEGKEFVSPSDVPSNGFFRQDEHQNQVDVQRESLQKNRVGKTLAVQNHQKTDAAKQRPGKTMVRKIQALVSKTKTDLGYAGPSRVPSSHKAQLLEDRHEHKRERSLDRVPAAQVHSGPKNVPSYDIDELLEEHDRQIQESAQSLRYEKRRANKVVVKEEEKQIKDHYVPSVPVLASGCNVDDLLEEHDRQIQESTQLRLEKRKMYRVNKP